MVNALELCNCCDVEVALPRSRGGYCDGCETAAQTQTPCWHDTQRVAINFDGRQESVLLTNAPVEPVVLEDVSEGEKVRNVVAWMAEGKLLIHGHYMGPEVEEWFRLPEYEWQIRLEPDQVVELQRRVGDDVLDWLHGRFAGRPMNALLMWFTENDIKTNFWNRVGR